MVQIADYPLFSYSLNLTLQRKQLFMFILTTNNSHDFKHAEFLQDCLLSCYAQTHGLKGILEIFDPKTPYYFMNNK